MSRRADALPLACLFQSWEFRKVWGHSFIFDGMTRIGKTIGERWLGMARLARVEVFAADEIAIMHVMNRTVRRCFLMGDDAFSGKDFDHRKQWLDE